MTRSLAAADEESVSTRTVRAYLGLGANLGDAAATLAEAIAVIDGLPGSRVRAVSRLFVTVPVGVADQPDFHNAVVAVDVPAGPDRATGALDLLVRLKAIERDFGRRRGRRWGPRELDLDLLVFGRAHLAIERPVEARSIDATGDPPSAATLLTVPHPAASSRSFVLAPLADLVPGLVPPGWGVTVETARRRQAVVEGPGAVRPIARWDPSARGWRRDQPR